MAGTVGAAQKAAVRFQNTPYFAAYLWDILAVEEHMVGNNQIQAVLFEGKPAAVKASKEKRESFAPTARRASRSIPSEISDSVI